MKRYEKILILIIAIATLTSCSNDDDIFNQITGNWKLIEAKSDFNPDELRIARQN